MQQFPSDWDLLTKINFLQRKILLNSIAYYIYDSSFISDHYYDSCCYQLVDLQNEYGECFIEDSMYGYAYYDFDGSTGYHLFGRLTKEDRDWLRDICVWKMVYNEPERRVN